MRYSLFFGFLLLVALLTALLAWRFPYVLGEEGVTYHLIYSGAVISLISSGMFLRYQGRLSTLCKQLLLWCAILLALTIGYNYRHVVMQSSFLTMFIPHRAAVLSDGSLEIRANADGHFYIEVEMNGTRIYAMIDTGASDIALSATDAKRLGIALDSLSYSKTYSTANGVIEAATLTIPHVKVGPFSWENIPVSVTRSPMPYTLLGMSFLRRFQQFSIRGDILQLVP